ncbi:MAG TPA: CHAP domain-containing protein [Candidatus Saccharimonadales bacterium]|nr:CHAP domain-containing protein [Candidatus Saccharimonadales bacterium]
MFDNWGEYNRECTSYAAWMLHSVNGFEMPFHDNAVGWGPDATARGYTVDMNPKPGSIYWTSSPQHVAWVESVSTNGSTVTLEDYNHANTGVWDEYPVATSSASGYIHFKDLSSGGSPWGGVGNAVYLGSDHLTAGQTMQPNTYLVSYNVQFVLMMQTDGNLVEYNNGQALWGAGTSGHPGAYLAAQGDGNIVIYDANGNALWGDGTNGTTLGRFVVQDDGGVVTYNSNNVPLWGNNESGHPTHTYFGSDTLAAGQTLPNDNYLRSANGLYAAIMQTDGNFMVYSPGYHVLWGAGTANTGANYAAMQTDGNFVLYRANNTAVWGSGTNGDGAAHVVMQTDGNFQMYRDSDGAPLWGTGTVVPTGPTIRPSAVAPNGNISVFYPNGSNLVDRYWTPSGGWQATSWVLNPASAASAIDRTTSTIDVFFRNSSNNLVDQSWDGSTWTTTTLVNDGSVRGDPSAITRSSDDMEVFYRDSSNNLHDEAWSSAGGWTNTSWAVGIAGNPSAVHRTSDTMDVFFQDASHNLIDEQWSASTGWSTATLLSDGSVAAAPGALAETAGNINVFYQGRDGYLHDQYWVSGGGWANASWHVAAVGTPSPIARDPGSDFDIFVRTTTGDIADEWFNATSGWQPAAILDSSGTVTTDPAAVNGDSANMDAFYGTSSNTLGVVWWNVNVGWNRTSWGW